MKNSSILGLKMFAQFILKSYFGILFLLQKISSNSFTFITSFFDCFFQFDINYLPRHVLSFSQRKTTV